MAPRRTHYQLPGSVNTPANAAIPRVASPASPLYEITWGTSRHSRHRVTLENHPPMVRPTIAKAFGHRLILKLAGLSAFTLGIAICIPSVQNYLT